MSEVQKKNVSCSTAGPNPLEMTSQQLDQLWKLDFKLAHELLGLPLRQCSAVPVKNWGNPMEDGEFERLKLRIRRMWLRAAVHFSVFKGPNDEGWGLQVNDQCEKNLSLTDNSYTVLGWLAVAPSPDECPSGHRYLRSPVGTTLYLGGPISLANWSSSPTVKCRASLSAKPSSKGAYFVSTLKPLPVGAIITWNYELRTKDPVFYSLDEWQVDKCCREGSADVSNPTCSCTSKKGTARHIRKRQRIIQAYKLCVYCGTNLEALCDDDPENSPPTKRNMKPHIALNHTVQLCLDQGLEIDSEIEGVSHAAFFSHLHMVTRVLNLLENHNYQVMPACHMFKVLGREPLPVGASRREKDQFFCDFMYEAQDAFRKYRVVCVRGISVPSCYEDLLPVCNTSYADVSWEGSKPPRSNTFTVKHLVPGDQQATLDREILVSMENIVKTYSDLLNSGQ